jgi:hypothetical protein
MPGLYLVCRGVRVCVCVAMVWELGEIAAPACFRCSGVSSVLHTRGLRFFFFFLGFLFFFLVFLWRRLRTCIASEARGKGLDLSGMIFSCGHLFETNPNFNDPSTRISVMKIICVRVYHSSWPRQSCQKHLNAGRSGVNEEEPLHVKIARIVYYTVPAKSLLECCALNRPISTCRILGGYLPDASEFEVGRL